MAAPVIPPEILTQHTAVLGKTGSGKTTTAKLIIEQAVAAGARVCVLDPIKSDWWGLTSSRNGKRGGLPFHILGGPHGHVPMHASAGKAIADVVASGALPLSIIDMADFEPGGQAKFFVDFAPRLLRKMRGVVYLVIEEAHLFAPKERSGIGAENLSIHWAKMLATAGRSKGIRLILVTQRTQALHNALLGSCDTLIAHRLTAPADQEPVVKWLKANTTPEILKRVSGELASLKTGVGWICSGEARIFEAVHFPRIATYDNTATPTGTGSTREIKTASIDLAKLSAIIGSAIEEARANDPTELRKLVKKLTADNQRAGAELTKLQAQVAARPHHLVKKTVAIPLLSARDRKTLDRLLKVATQLDEHFRELTAASMQAGKRAEHVTEEVRQFAAGVLKKATPEPENLTVIPQPTAAAPKPTPAAPSNGKREVPVGMPVDGEGKLKKGAREILAALVARDPVPMTRGQVALLVGIKTTGSTMSAYMSNLRTGGYLVEQGDLLNASEAGIAYFGAQRPTAVRSVEDTIALWNGRLKKGARQLLEYIYARSPQAVPREDLASLLEIEASGSTLSAYLSNLRVAGLIEDRSGGAVAFSSALLAVTS